MKKIENVSYYIKSMICITAHIAISLSFSLSMFKRAAVRDFFSTERDLDRSLAECADRECDL